MGKLVLGSGGIFFEHESDPIIDHIISLIDDKNDMKMVYLPTGCHDNPEDDENVYNYCMSHGFTSCISLHLSDESLTDEYIKETILSASVVYAGGGNLMFILDTWRKTKADIYLRQAYENGTVIAGQSSGGMCWCRRGYDNCGENGSFMFLDGLDFIPYIMCPHFEDWQHFLEAVRKQDLDAICIDNDIAVSVVDGEYEIIDSHRNPRHSAFYMPAKDGFPVIDIMRNHVHLDF